MTSTELRSGRVAAEARVNPQTLRYYERRGLLDTPMRSLGGQRLYPPETVVRLRVIKAAQRLGFTLEEVADLLQAGRHRHGHSPDRAMQEITRAKLSDVEAKIADLTMIAQTLRAALTAGCEDPMTCATRPDCPLPFAGIADADLAVPA
ncbi:MAG: MerR family transcriptional regulator, partial [Jiangellaceae bacterium]